MEKITITETIRAKFKLPVKALGTWAITAKGDEMSTLHIIKKDGTLGSNRSNNIYKIHTDILEKIMPKPKPQKADGVLSVRKAKWIDLLIEEMKTDPFLLAMIERQGEKTVREQILKDTDPNREGSKAYSSIPTAITVWSNRARKEAKQ